MNTLRASINESSQRGVRAWRVSESPLRALRDSQTIRELSNSQKAHGPASGNKREGGGKRRRRQSGPRGFLELLLGIESFAMTTKPYLWFYRFYHHQNYSPPPAQSLWSRRGPPSPRPFLNLKCEIIKQIQCMIIMRWCLEYTKIYLKLDFFFLWNTKILF